MEVIRMLFQSIVAFVFSVICVGGGTAIAIVATVRGNPSHLLYAISGAVGLTLLGGYVALLASPYRPSIKLSGGLSGVSFAFARRDPGSPEAVIRQQSILIRLFAALALLCAGVLSVGGGIAVLIVASVKVDPARLPNAHVAMWGGLIQCLFGGYLAMLSTGARPWIKASGGLQEGLSLELTEEPPPVDQA